ncbi:MAG: hypothetical protein KF797_14450, partial [Flavobacteriales bacterium]|nr:hypothetical protein [Flavobacteriales bacterium]
MRDAKPLATPPGAAALDMARRRQPLDELGALTLTLVNGSLVPSLSDLSAREPGLTVVPLAQALADGSPHVGLVGKVA